MVAVSEFCNECGRGITLYISQSIFDRQIFWHSSYCCSHCGMSLETDDRGIPPEPFRKVILAAEGQYSLKIEASGKKAIVATQVLRSAMNLSLTAATELRRKIPGIVAVGTRAEMEWYTQLLRGDEIDCAVEKDG